MSHKIKYPVLIYPAEEGGYFAEVPALKGCIAQGESVEDLLTELGTVMELWIETATRNNQPLPRTDYLIEQIRNIS